MSETRVAVVIPTLAADDALDECVRSVAAQSLRQHRIVVVDNSGSGLARLQPAVREHAEVIQNRTNVGFGAAVNQGIRASNSEYVAVLNDDAKAHPEWLERMIGALDGNGEIGMCAPRILLAGTGKLDSAGMRMARDGSSKQDGHGSGTGSFERTRPALLPSGCAALYRRAMLDDVGLFDERFFLYCEDTDLGLRARWRLWDCIYVPEAVVEHRYSHSAGAASALKAFYVERNRLFVAIKNFPLGMLPAVPLFTLIRYFWHLVFLAQGRGKAAELAREERGTNLALVAFKAWFAAAAAVPDLLRERRRIMTSARATPAQLARTLDGFRISEREVASL